MRKIFILIGLFLTLSLSGQILPGVVASQGVVAAGDYPAILDDGNTEAWYSAEAENVTLDASDSLITWNDITANNRDMGLEGTYQPFWDADGVHMLNVGDAAAIRHDVNIAKPLSIYIVFKQVSWTSQDEILSMNSSGPLFKQYFTGTRCYVYDDANLGPVEPALDTWVLVTIILNSGATSSIQMNDDAAATATIGANGLETIKLGGVDVVIKELIVRSNSDDATGQTQIKGYLNDKYIIY